jgi:hypothetical protein
MVAESDTPVEDKLRTMRKRGALKGGRVTGQEVQPWNVRP